MGAPSTREEIRRRRTRREKIDLLRRRYAKAGSEADRDALWAKARKVAPQISYEEFRKPIPQQAKATA
jgi:hypothetical protein